MSVRLPKELLERIAAYAASVRDPLPDYERPSVAKVVARVLEAGLKELTRPRKGNAA